MGDEYIVTEWCPSCENEIEMRWSVEEMGYKAFCPVCGNRLMLCDECQHGENPPPCDYDRETDTCRFNRRKSRGHKTIRVVLDLDIDSEAAAEYDVEPEDVLTGVSVKDAEFTDGVEVVADIPGINRATTFPLCEGRIVSKRLL